MATANLGDPRSPNEVELCSISELETLRTDPRRRKARPPRPLRGEKIATVRAASRIPRRCTCAVCAKCVEDQRWNRIFEAKFADPTYYSRPLLRQGSSLNLD